MSDNNVDNVADAIKGTVDKTRDAIHENEHLTNADAEKARRENDPTMSATDKAASIARETKERAQAKIDETKRESHK